MSEFSHQETESEDHWVSISDIMSGLMMVFLFVSVLYMHQVFKDKDKIEQIAVTYNKMQNKLYEDLDKEFQNDLEKWNAEIERQTLTIRFKEPEILFGQGSIEVKHKFKEILTDFFPRYISILTRPDYKNDIEEIRIEGHTSSEWDSSTPPDLAYIRNMELSQGRTRSVLEYVISISELRHNGDVEWVQNHLTANGLSSSKIIVNSNGEENKTSSRRVEFRVRTNAEKRIVEIINRD